MGSKLVKELLLEYEQYLSERRSLEASKRGDSQALKDKYLDLQGELKSFCLDEDFLSAIQKLCDINKGKLAFSPNQKRIEYKGQSPAPMRFNHNNCFEVKERAKDMMREAFADEENFENESAIKNLCVGYVTLVAMVGAAGELFAGALEEKNARLIKTIGELNAKMKKCEDSLEKKIIELSGDEERGIYIGSCAFDSNSEVVSRLAHNLQIGEELPDERIMLSTREGCSSVFINVSDKEKRGGDFSDFLNGIFYGNFLKFQVGDLLVACVEDSELYSLPLSYLNASMIKNGNDEANLSAYSYGAVAQDVDATTKLLKSIKNELNERKTLLGSSDSYKSIEEYNSQNPYNKKPYILLLMNGYRNMLSRYGSKGELSQIVQDGGRYGIFAVIMEDENKEIDENDGYATDLSELDIRRIDFSAPEFKRVSISFNEVDEIRKRAKSELKQSDILYLDQLIAMDDNADSEFPKEMSIPVGISGGVPYRFATSIDATKGKYHSSPFTLAIGSTGMGKSAFLHTLILSGGWYYSPDQLQFYIVDFKSKQDSAEFACYLHKDGVENLYIPHVKYLSMQSKAENAYDVLNMINMLADERAALFASVGAKDFIAYNSDERIQSKVKQGELPPVPQIYFLIDEYITMLDGGVGGNDEARAELEGKFSDILQRIRTSGVGLIFSGQRCVFKQATMGLIGNRISFDPGSENLLNSMFTFNYERGEDSSAIYRSISGKIGTAIFTRSAGAEIKDVVRTAFAGKHMGERQMAIARAIREKYSDPRYYGNQIIPGADIMENGNTFLSEYCSGPITQDERVRQAKEKEKNIPMYIGVESMSSKPVALKYFLQKKKGAVILAKPLKQQFVERNIAISLLHYMATNGNAPKYQAIILNDMSSQDVLFDEFGNIIEGESARHALVESLNEQGLSELCAVNNTATDIATAVLSAEELWQNRLRGKCSDKKPILIIMHDADELVSLQSYLDSEAKNRKEEEGSKAENAEEKTAESASDNAVTNAEEVIDADTAVKEAKKADGNVVDDGDEEIDMADLQGLFSDGDMDGVIGILYDPDTNVDNVEIESALGTLDDKDKKLNDANVKKALRHLLEEGNKQNILILFSFSNAAVAENMLAINLTSREKLGDHCGVIFGSDTVRKTRDVYKDDNSDCCFMMPQELKARLYDFSDNAKDFWTNLKKYY